MKGVLSRDYEDAANSKCGAINVTGTCVRWRCFKGRGIRPPFLKLPGPRGKSKKYELENYQKMKNKCCTSRPGSGAIKRFLHFCIKIEVVCQHY